MYKPYSIYTPPYDLTSGGIRVLWGLYGWLLAKGETVILNGIPDDPDSMIAIYPEIVNGSPLKCGTVVRYILQTPGVMSMFGQPSPTTEEYKTNPLYKNDKFFVFSRIYDTFGVDDDHILFLPILNLHIFKNQGLKRTKTCYLVGKGQNQMKHPKDSIEITREFAQDQQALADLLNKCSVFYCYDRLSAMMEISRLCGARVQYYGDFPLKELTRYEPGMNGLGYTDEKVQLDVDDFRAHYIDMIREFDRKLDYFIDVTQK